MHDMNVVEESQIARILPTPPKLVWRRRGAERCVCMYERTSDDCLLSMLFG